MAANRKKAAEPEGLENCPTGISGLDESTGGGGARRSHINQVRDFRLTDRGIVIADMHADGRLKGDENERHGGRKAPAGSR